MTVPRNGIEPSCSSSMVNTKLGWASKSTWRNSIADSVMGIVVSVVDISLIKRRDRVVQSPLVGSLYGT